MKVALTASRFMMVCPVSLKTESRNLTLTKGQGYTGKEKKKSNVVKKAEGKTSLINDE